MANVSFAFGSIRGINERGQMVRFTEEIYNKILEINYDDEMLLQEVTEDGETHYNFEATGRWYYENTLLAHAEELKELILKSKDIKDIIFLYEDKESSNFVDYESKYSIMRGELQCLDKSQMSLF